MDIVTGYAMCEFRPWATMFKLDRVDGKTVECESCHAMFPLSDLLCGELEENQCPRCGVTADEYWRGRVCRVVPRD